MLGLAQPLPDPHFIRPVVGRVVVGSGFGVRTLDSGKKQFHAAIDIKVPNGTVVQAIGDGEVMRLQKDPDADGGGIHIGIRHPNGMISRYLHLMRYDVALGQKVTQGQQIGLSNNTGNSAGPHLHFELRVPAELIPRIEATVGKPTIGWGASMTNYGVGISPDSWIPVDEYRPSTLANLRRYKIPLYGEWAGSGGKKVSNFAKLPKTAMAGGIIGLAALGLLLSFGLYRRSQRPLTGAAKPKPKAKAKSPKLVATAKALIAHRVHQNDARKKFSAWVDSKPDFGPSDNIFESPLWIARTEQRDREEEAWDKIDNKLVRDFTRAGAKWDTSPESVLKGSWR